MRVPIDRRNSNTSIERVLYQDQLEERNSDHSPLKFVLRKQSSLTSKSDLLRKKDNL